jgi:hypothetical protein
VHPAAVFNPSANTGQRTVAAHGLSLFIPAGAIITRPIIDVITTFTSAADTATIALHLQTANDLQTAIAIGDESTAWDAGVREVSVTLFKLTAERQLTATVAVQAQHAGKVNVHVEYFLAGA